MKQKIIDIKAVPKPRQTRSDKWKQRPCVVAYRTFADELRLKFGKVPEAANAIRVTFAIKVPDSWSRKRKAHTFDTAHQQKPDIDNLLKAVMDALLPEDKGIARIECQKFWSDVDRITISLGEV